MRQSLMLLEFLTEDEVEAAVASSLDFWLTLGNEGTNFQNELSDFRGLNKHY